MSEKYVHTKRPTPDMQSYQSVGHCGAIFLADFGLDSKLRRGNKTRLDVLTVNPPIRDFHPSNPASRHFHCAARHVEAPT